MLGVSVDQDPGRVKGFLSDNPLPYTLAWDSDDIAGDTIRGNDINDNGLVAFVAGNATADTGIYTDYEPGGDPPVTIATVAGPSAPSAAQAVISHFGCLGIFRTNTRRFAWPVGNS